jgi:hypothetical protein
MATYLQGVQSYIPAIQHFQPDLNILANVLEKKQNQYDSNFKAINDMYGKYFYADLSRKDNLQRKDAMLKQIDLDLKRISGLDLSLSQNANQALQVFKPFYEDGYLMKDMAATKNYKNRRGDAESMKNSKDKEKRDQYWLTGVKAMDYQMEEFKDMPLEQTLGFQDPTYTPYKNPTEYFTKLAKDADLSIDITQPTKDGMYFVRKKNGELLIDPLSTLFSSAVANDPALQQIYATQAYVDRKDNIYSKKDQYGGNLEESERAYLTEEYRKLQEFNKQFSEKSQSNLSEKKAIKKDVDKAYQDGSYSERTDQATQTLDESIQTNEAVANQAKSLNETLSSGTSASSVTSNGVAENLDLETLRSKVDYGRAVQLMSRDINASVSSLMNKDRVEDIEVNPVGLEGLRHGHRMSEMKTKFGYDIQKMEYKAALDWNAYTTKKNVDNGVLQINADGTTDYTAEYKETLVKKATGDGFFQELEKGDALAANKSYLDFQAKENSGVVLQMLQFYKGQLDRERTENGPNNKTNDVWGAIFGNYGDKRGIEGLIADMNKDPAGTMKKLDISRAVDVFTQEAKGHYKGMASAEEILRNPQFLELDSYGALLKDMDKVDKDNTEAARKGITRNINVKDAGLVDEPWYRLNANDIELDIFKKSELDEMNTRMGRLAMLNVSSGLVNEKQFDANIRNDKTKLSNGLTVSQMLQQIDSHRSKNAAGQPTVGGVFAWNYVSQQPAPMSEILYDKYKANWDENKGSMIFKTLNPGTMIPGAKGQIYSLQAGYQTGKTILPDAFGTPNRNLWTETMKDVRGINFNDANNKISFNGLGKTASNDTERGLQILNAINNGVLKGDGPKFDVYQSQMAQGDPSKGAMIIYPTVKQLTDLGLVGGTDADKKTLSNSEAALLAQKGISVIGDRGYFNNWLFKDAMISPGEARMNVAGPNGISYSDPFGTGNYTIKPNYGSDNSITSYNMSTRFMQIDPETGESKWFSNDRTSVPLGGEIDNYMRDTEKALINVGKQNDGVYRKFNPKK